MSLHKIHPSQIQLPVFSSEYVDLAFSDLTTGFIINLNRNLTGDFNINGSLVVSGKSPLYINTSNQYDLINGNRILGGNNNYATGSQYNSILAGSENYVTGSYNQILNGYNGETYSGSSFNTALAGYQFMFDPSVQGSSFIGDRLSTNSISKSNALDLNFTSGYTIVGNNSNFFTEFRTEPYSDIYFNGNLNCLDTVNFNNQLYIDSMRCSNTVFFNSGFSATSGVYINNTSTNIIGNININDNLFVTGNVYVTGSIYAENFSGLNLNISDSGLFDGVQVNQSGVYTGSKIATQSSINDSGYFAQISNLTGLTITNNITGGGIAYISNLTGDFYSSYGASLGEAAFQRFFINNNFSITGTTGSVNVGSISGSGSASGFKPVSLFECRTEYVFGTESQFSITNYQQGDALLAFVQDRTSSISDTLLVNCYITGGNTLILKCKSSATDATATIWHLR
jgi:hypothetical protein